MARSKSTGARYTNRAQEYLRRRALATPRIKAERPFVPPKPVREPTVRCREGMSAEDCLHMEVSGESYQSDPRQTIGGGSLTLHSYTPTVKIYRRAGSDDYIVGARGTDNAYDVLTDAALAAGALQLTSRYRDDKRLLQDFFAKAPTARVRFTGHSLGGAVARQLSRDFGTQSAGGVTFNSAMDATHLKPSAAAGMVNYYTTGDLLGKLARASSGHDLRYLPTNHILNPLRAHKLTEFKAK
jgi:hypothetical protein